MQFSLSDLKMNDMWRYERHWHHLSSVATLPYESQNTENVLLQWDITKENCIRCIIASSKWTRVIMWLNVSHVQRSFATTSLWLLQQFCIVFCICMYFVTVCACHIEIKGYLLTYLLSIIQMCGVFWCAHCEYFLSVNQMTLIRISE